MLKDVENFVTTRLTKLNEFCAVRVALKLLNTVMKNLTDQVSSDMIVLVGSLPENSPEVAVFCYEFSKVELPRKDFSGVLGILRSMIHTQDIEVLEVAV